MLKLQPTLSRRSCGCHVWSDVTAHVCQNPLYSSDGMTKLSVSKDKDTHMLPRLEWTTDELDQLSTILDEYQVYTSQRLADLQQFYGSRVTRGFVELMEHWVSRAAALRAKIERR